MAAPVGAVMDQAIGRHGEHGDRRPGAGLDERLDDLEPLGIKLLRPMPVTAKPATTTTRPTPATSIIAPSTTAAEITSGSTPPTGVPGASAAASASPG